MTRHKTGSFSFKPRAKLLKLLGEQLIRDPNIALFELVKNAYDADASTVEVQLHNPSDRDNGTIAVLDDGSGMTIDTVVNVWLQPGDGISRTAARESRAHAALQTVAARREGHWSIRGTQTRQSRRPRHTGRGVTRGSCSC